MRISSSKVHHTSSHSINLEASGEILDSFYEESSDPQNPAKGDEDDAHTLLLSSEESEEQEKVTTNFPFKRYIILIKGSLILE